MLQAQAGIIAMHDPVRNLTFAKRSEYNPAARYPLNTNLALYVGSDNFMVEMETMGPQETIKPGGELHHLETWVLKDGARPLTTAAEIHNSIF